MIIEPNTPRSESVCPAINNSNALPLGLCFFERRNLATGKINLRLGRTKGSIGNRDLGGVDQRLAIEAHVAPLRALGTQTILILKRVVDTIKRDNPCRFGRQQTQLQ